MREPACPRCPSKPPQPRPLGAAPPALLFAKMHTRIGPPPKRMTGRCCCWGTSRLRRPGLRASRGGTRFRIRLTRAPASRRGQGPCRSSSHRSHGSAAARRRAWFSAIVTARICSRCAMSAAAFSSCSPRWPRCLHIAISPIAALTTIGLFPGPCLGGVHVHEAADRADVTGCIVPVQPLLELVVDGWGGRILRHVELLLVRPHPGPVSAGAGAFPHLREVFPSLAWTPFGHKIS
jgi:hypothetical protein